MPNCSIEILPHKNAAEPMRFFWGDSFETSNQFPLHINKYYEAYIYISGNVSYVVENNYYNLNKGDIILVRPNEIHRPVLHENCQYERFYVLFPKDSFNFLPADIPSPLDTINKNHQAHIVSLPQDKREKMLDTLYKISALAATEKPDRLSIYNRLIEFLCVINEFLTQPLQEQAQQNVKNSTLPPILQNVLHYINSNLTEIQTVDEIAKHFYISTPYLSSVFKKYIRVNIVQYISIKKIAYARTLLETDPNITSVCFKSGFNNCSYFIKQFRRYVGITPKQYVTEHLEVKK